MSDKLLSIIVPSYNMEGYICKAVSFLDGLNSRDRESLDVIIVNDGSKDRTSILAHQLAELYYGIVSVIDKANGHYGSCINSALPMVKGTFVRLLDADDHCCAQEMAKFLDQLAGLQSDATGVDLIVSGYEKIDPKGCVTFRHVSSLPARVTLTFEDLVERRVLLSNPEITYRTQLLREIEYKQTEGRPYTDMEWVVLPMSKVRKIVYVDAVVYQYLIGREGQSVSEMGSNFNHFKEIVLRLAFEYARQIAGVHDSNVKAYRQRVVNEVQTVYRMYLIMRCGANEGLSQLRDFDERLKVGCPEIYREASLFKVKTLTGAYAYVSSWRESNTISRFNILSMKLRRRLDDLFK